MRTLATLGLMASAIAYTSPAAAQEDDGPDAEVYGTLLPFFESVGTTGATPRGAQSQTTLVSNAYTGINHERRFRMSSGTSNIGFKGDWTIAPDALKLIWQVESPAPIDGEGPSNWANRNSHAGFSGPWGTLVYGNWDTPMRWVTVTSVNPIRGGYTGDMTAIIGSPGHSIPAWNADQTFVALFRVPPNGAGFFRHEANSVQYWSPDLAGFSVRLMYAANEHRTAGIPAATPDMPPTEIPLDPWLVSGYVGYDNGWLRLRYSYELHKDYFGMAFTGAGPHPDRPSSTDVGHLGLASVKINADTPHETRLVVTGDYLDYHTDVVAGSGILNEFSRAAVYGLVQQKFSGHNIWGAYGYADEGDCSVTPPPVVAAPVPAAAPADPAAATDPTALAAVGGTNACTTTGLSANYYTLGYMYEFSPSTGIYGIGYFVQNDISARYTPFPLLDSRTATDRSLPNIGEISHGSDVLGIGIGFVHTFSAKIWGDEPKKTPPTRADEPRRPTREESSPPEEAASDASPSEREPADETPMEEDVSLDEQPEEEAPVDE